MIQVNKLVDKYEAARLRAFELKDLLTDRLFDAYRTFRLWKNRPHWAYPGAFVCCCDLQHKVIARITGDDAIMTDGVTYSITACLDPVKPDDSCHKLYLGKKVNRES